MSLCLECIKVKRTGFLPAFIAGGILAALVPLVNMAFRSEFYMESSMPPLKILLDENWQMMAMFNILLVVAGTCLMYHLEYAENAIQRMCTLPVRESGMFFGKFVLALAACIMMLAIEAAAIAFCCVHWFGKDADLWNLAIEILKNFGYFFLLMLPVILCSLLIASLCENMWTSLGIGVLCVFIATMIPVKNFALSIFPYALPFQIFVGKTESIVRNYVIAGMLESVIAVAAEVVLLKIRRWFA